MAIGALYVFICAGAKQCRVCACICVCSSTYSRVQLVCLIYFFIFFSSASVFFAYFNSWLFTLEVQECASVCWACSCIVGMVLGHRDWLCAYFAFSHSDATMQFARESGITPAQVPMLYAKEIFELSLPYSGFAVAMPKVGPKNAYNLFCAMWPGGNAMEHLWMSVVDSIRHT